VLVLVRVLKMEVRRERGVGSVILRGVVVDGVLMGELAFLERMVG
jgi:hypothetical protein